MFSSVNITCKCIGDYYEQLDPDYDWPSVPNVSDFYDGLLTSMSVFETSTSVFETSTSVFETSTPVP